MFLAYNMDGLSDELRTRDRGIGVGFMDIVAVEGVLFFVDIGTILDVCLLSVASDVVLKQSQ